METSAENDGTKKKSPLINKGGKRDQGQRRRVQRGKPQKRRSQGFSAAVGLSMAPSSPKELDNSEFTKLPSNPFWDTLVGTKSANVIPP